MQTVQETLVSSIRCADRQPYQPPSLESHLGWDALTGISLPIGNVLGDLLEGEE
jgi:hypothetical protein